MHFLPELLRQNQDKGREETKMHLGENNSISKQNIVDELERSDKIEEKSEDLSAIEMSVSSSELKEIKTRVYGRKDERSIA